MNMKNLLKKSDVIKRAEGIYEIPRSFRADMRVPARVYVSEHMLDKVLLDSSLWQLINVASLPGIQKYAIAMPDVHEGYGFPIGGVAAMAADEGGVISPGGIGYDINCGVRLLASSLQVQDISHQLGVLAERLFRAVPSGTGRGGLITLSDGKLDRYLNHGAEEAVLNGYGDLDDLKHCEEQGSFAGADAAMVSLRAKERGRDQLGTLGSGNHFLEVQVVDEIFDEQVAKIFSLSAGQVTVMIHCGSRGLGHQVCTDYVAQMLREQASFGISLCDRQLACAPIASALGQAYFSAMKAAANFAFANRHIIGHHVRQSFSEVFKSQGVIKTVYDVCHNVGKLEKHVLHGVQREFLVHRKGATRAFGPGDPHVPKTYRACGQPVLIPGTMGTASYVLVGAGSAVNDAFGSCCHGAGRTMSRMQAKKSVSGRILRDQLNASGILVKSDSDRGLAEEAPTAYKDIEEVIGVVENTGLARRVARLRPIAVIKGD